VPGTRRGGRKEFGRRPACRPFEHRRPLLCPAGIADDKHSPLLRSAHASRRTTKLYDRTGEEITLDEVERIVI